MTSSDPGTRRGAHRTSRDASAALLPSALAILAVASLITALYVWRGEDPGPPEAAAATTAALAKPSSTPAAGTKAAATPPPTSTPPATSAATSAPATSAAAAQPSVVVLNQTRRHGLASTVADRLRGRGWTVTNVGNFRGNVPATTVYYPAGAEAAATAAAGNLPTPARIRPRFGNLSATRLTIVVTDNYPS
ncbi:MAG: LytR C-terminal domain-containing protein [Oryzihumus sp.]